jgi:hypothetical protein
VNNELGGCGWKQSPPNFKVLSQKFPGESEENHENARSPGRVLNAGHFEFKAVLMTTMFGVLLMIDVSRGRFISGFGRHEDEICARLAYYAEQSGNSVPTFGTTCQTRLQA